MARPAMFLENCRTSDPTLGFLRRRSRECVKPSASTSSPLSRADRDTKKEKKRKGHTRSEVRPDRRRVQRGGRPRNGTNFSRHARSSPLHSRSLFSLLSPSSHWPRGSWHEKYSLNACLASLMPRASAVPTRQLPPPRSWDDTGTAAAILFAEEPPPPLAPPPAAPAPAAAPAARKKVQEQEGAGGEQTSVQSTNEVKQRSGGSLLRKNVALHASSVKCSIKYVRRSGSGAPERESCKGAGLGFGA